MSFLTCMCRSDLPPTGGVICSTFFKNSSSATLSHRFLKNASFYNAILKCELCILDNVSSQSGKTKPILLVIAKCCKCLYARFLYLFT